MSLLSPDRLTLWLAPEEVQAVRTSGMGQRITALRRLPLNEAASGDWTECLESCRVLVEEYKPKVLHVVVSDRLVRYLVLPWNPQVQGASEEMALARIEFEDTYGEQSAGDWTFSVSTEKPGINRLVCALPTALIEGLRALARSNRVRLQSMQPNLIAVMRSQRRDLGPQGWFINMEGGRLTLLHWNQGGVFWVSSGRCAPRSLESALSVLRREMLISGTASGSAAAQMPIFLVNPMLNLTPAAPDSDLKVEVAGLSARTLGRVRRIPADTLGPQAELSDYRAVLMGAQL